METIADSPSSVTKKRKKKQQTTKKITEKKQKITEKKPKVQKPKTTTTVVAALKEGEEPKPKPKRGRKKKVVVPIKVTTEKVDEIFITDEQPVYCRAPIEFGGMTIFTKIERPPTPPPPVITQKITKSGVESVLENNNKIQKKVVVKLKNENKWKTKVDQNNLKELKTRIENENIVCWYCTHGFEGNAVSCPVNYSIRRGYLCHGVFCGWGCVKSWNMETNSQKKFQRNDFINKLIRISNNGAYVRIQPSPSRYLLKKFGGNLDIKEFREVSSVSFENNDLFHGNGLTTSGIEINFTQKTPCSEIEF